MSDAAIATAPAQPSPAGQSPAASAAPSQTQGFVAGADEQKKVEIIMNMQPKKYAELKRHLLEMQASGHTRENSTEYAKLAYIIELRDKATAMQAQRAASLAASAAAGSPAAQATSPATAPTPDAAVQAPMPRNKSLNHEQGAQLRAQTAAFQLLAQSQPVPSAILQAAQGKFPPPLGGQPDLASNVAERTVDAIVSDAVEKAAASADVSTVPSGTASVAKTPPPSGPPYAREFDASSLIYPYNAYTHPSAYLRDFDKELEYPTTKLQRMIVPSVMPRGLDPAILMQERNRYVENRMAWRMKELESLSAVHGAESGAKDVHGIVNGERHTPANIRARIELLSLRLVGKQRLLREDVIRSVHGAAAVPADRAQFRRFRTHVIRDARATESAERRQRTEREQRGKQRHLAYIKSICDHGEAIKDAGRGSARGAVAQKMGRLGKAMLKMQGEIEKEEQRRLEKIAKERLKLLKADDEEGYLALLGEAKDDRIGHLLKQTDSYLETLANAVREQQNTDVHREAMQHWEPFEVEDGPANEAMFGARRHDEEEEEADKKAGKVDYYAVAHHIQEKVTKQSTLLTGGTLKDYQVKGLQWMISLYNNRLNGILADEMGLGKTIQTISLITYLIEKKHQSGPFLVIVPLSTLTNWTMEFERWAPAVSTVILKGTPAQRKEAYGRIRALDFQVCLTTYEYIIKERQLLAKIKWIHMIIDEGHRMKNVKSKLSQTLNEYYSTRYRLILTGTPLQNNLPELWALLNFVLPKIFNSVKSFDEWFSAPFDAAGGEKVEMTEEEALLVVKRLHKVLRPFLLRRLKKDVESELPDKVERVIYTKMSGLQWALYDNVKKYKRLPTDTGPNSSQRKGGKAALQNMYMQLRKIANHPFVFPEVEEDFTQNEMVDEQIMRTSGKFELLDRILPKLFKTGHKVLIFFQMTEVMTLIADFFAYRGWNTCRLDGSTKADDRQELLSKFNNPDSPYQVFILSTRAGGLGLNLQSADTVIIFDTDWNPHADLQAQDRAHRIGQKKEVRVLRLISSKTIEELVLERAQKKLELDGKVIQAGKFDDKTTSEEYEKLLAAHFESGGADEDDEEVNELDDDELNELLARGDHELEIFAQMDKERLAERTRVWTAAGEKGPLPPAIMEASELPPFYRRDLGAEMAEAMQAEEDAGRGRRARNVVQYNSDLLSDAQWLRDMGESVSADEGGDSDEDPAEQRKNKAARRQERKRLNEQLRLAEAEGKPLAATSIKLKGAGGDEDDALGAAGAGAGPAGTPTPMGAGVKGKKRSRPRVSATPSVQGDDAPLKKRKMGTGVPGQRAEHEVAIIKTLYDETNALQDDEGTMLNMYFVKPVDKKIFTDYAQYVDRPICMDQIKRKFGQARYALANFREEMLLLFSNAKTYNPEGSWVHMAAQRMEDHFVRRYDEELAAVVAANAGAGASGSGSANGGRAGAIKREDSIVEGAGGGAVAGGSGSSTPMFKGPATRLPPRIKINVGASKRREAIVAPSASASASGASGASGGSESPVSGKEASDSEDEY